MTLINFISRIIIKFTSTMFILMLLTAIVVTILYYTDMGGSRNIIIEKYQIINSYYSNDEEYLVELKK